MCRNSDPCGVMRAAIWDLSHWGIHCKCCGSYNQRRLSDRRVYTIETRNFSLIASFAPLYATAVSYKTVFLVTKWLWKSSAKSGAAWLQQISEFVENLNWNQNDWASQTSDWAFDRPVSWWLIILSPFSFPLCTFCALVWEYIFFVVFGSNVFDIWDNSWLAG